MTPEHALKLMEADGVPRLRSVSATDASWEVSQSVAAWLDADGAGDLVVYVSRVLEGGSEVVRLKLIRSDQDWCSRDIPIAQG